MSNDRSYLSALQDYYTRHHAFPSYSSIGILAGLRSKSSVAALVARLKLAEHIESTPDRRIAPTRRFFERPLAEAPVQAGLPNPIDDAPADALTIDDYLIDRPSQTVLVRVKGDSMTDAGIFDGDLVVVEKRSAARRGDIVIAIVDNQFTLERLDLERAPVRPPGKQGLSGHPPEGALRSSASWWDWCASTTDRRRGPVLGSSNFDAGDLDQDVVERRRASHIGQRLAGDHVRIGAVGRQLAPPDRRHDHDTRPRAIGDACGKDQRAAIVVHAHLVSVADASRRRILGIDIEPGRLFRLQKHRQSAEGRIEGIARRR